MARATSSGVSRSKWAGTACSSVVLGPRPSALRAAAQSASGPTSSPPPQSPVIRPSAAKRATRPSSATPTQLMPAPQTRATPQPRSVPVRSTAKVSFATSLRGAQPCSASAFCRVSSSSGRSAPAIITLETSATGRWSTSTPASAAALWRSVPSTSIEPFTPSLCCELPGPLTAESTAPSLRIRARSVFELPPPRPVPAGRSSRRPLRHGQRDARALGRRQLLEQLGGELVLADQRVGEQRLLRGDRVAAHGGAGCEPLIGRHVPRQADQLRRQLGLVERLGAR